MRNDDTAILVVSYDGYADMWHLFFKTFFTYWPHCPYKVFLMTNKKSFHFEGVNVLGLGKDDGWSKNLLKSITLLNEYKNLILFIDDAFLCSKVNSKDIQDAIVEFDNIQGKFLTLVSEPKPTKKSNEIFGSIEHGEPYRVTATFALWNVDFLKEFLVPEENAWEFEKKGSRRSDKYEKGFFSVNEDKFNYIHGVFKGKWHPNAIKALNEKGFDFKIDREVMSLKERLKFDSYRSLRSLIFALVPKKLKKYLIIN
tara:strand:+ start:2917 stop:3681 length:765 start_codon:yes stop_codon:yes gene_type:complete